MELEAAIEVFVRAFCIAKSVAHPYVPERIDDVWIMRDGPGRKNPRKIEVVTTGLAPSEVVERIRKNALGWHFVCEVHSAEQDYNAIRAAYKAAGYRGLSTEWLFHHNLGVIPAFQSDPPVRQIRTQAEADAIPQRSPRRFRVSPEKRLFVAWDEARDYGWVKSIPVGTSAWPADLWVHKDARGKGFGRSLMSVMLQTDKSCGVQDSVLVASSDGARLYPHLGYQRMATLQLFCPMDRGRFKA
jgi:GNAT superfamily N-acetyltransferase